MRDGDRDRRCIEPEVSQPACASCCGAVAVRRDREPADEPKRCEGGNRANGTPVPPHALVPGEPAASHDTSTP